MNIFDVLDGLEKVLPILGGVTGNPEIGILAAKLLDLGEEELQRRMSKSERSRSEELADAAATFQRFREENAALQKLGHKDS